MCCEVSFAKGTIGRLLLKLTLYNFDAEVLVCFDKGIVTY